MPLSNDHLKLLANAARHGLSKVAIDAPIQYVLNTAIAIAEVEKQLQEPQPTVAANVDHG